MASEIETRLAAAGLTLPEPAKALANYVPFSISGSTVYISGQLPLVNGKLHATGLLGADVSIEIGTAAARICALNILAQLRAACDGDLSRATRCLKLGGFVACTQDFTDHPKVINGASDLMVEAMGEGGRHARFAVGASSLPLNAAVEVEGTFEIVT